MYIVLLTSTAVIPHTSFTHVVCTLLCYVTVTRVAQGVLSESLLHRRRYVVYKERRIGVAASQRDDIISTAD